MRSIHVVLIGSLPWLVSIASSQTAGIPPPQSAAAIEERVPEGLTANDWASIRMAYEAGRQRVLAVDGVHRARNPGQQWTTSFDGCGFTTTPDTGGWIWGLELASYGWGTDLRAVSLPESVAAEGGRVAYVWDECITEWYVNDSRGLEHGYAVAARPEWAIGQLVIELSIRGKLVPEVSADGRDVRFSSASDGTVLSYSGLAVRDSLDRPVAAAWEALPVGLRLVVDDQDARYPLSIDPIAQQAYLKASNTEDGDSFGAAVALFGDTVVVGADDEDSNATGVNGDQSNNLAADSGAVYVFVRSGTTWAQEAYLKASNTEAGDSFGAAVALFGDTLVVGAYDEDSYVHGVNGNQSNNLASDSGAAYVFVRSGGTWSQQAYLKASNTDAGDQFGWSVSLSGNTLVVGAVSEDSNGTGVNGFPGNGHKSSGAAYVFVREGSTWSQQAYLKASNTDAWDQFGWSVSLSGHTLVVGANHEDSNATGVNGHEGNNLVIDSGAVYVFVREGSTWTQQAYVKASNTGTTFDNFGISVSTSGDTLVVGASGEDSNATGVNGDQSNNLAGNSGAAYVFVRNGTSWSQQAYLKASNTGGSDSFGFSVSVHGDRIAVGAYHEDNNATGVNGNQNNGYAGNSGAAYVFVRSGSIWSHVAYVKASNPEVNDFFGQSLSLSGDTLIVGAPCDESSVANAGAAYVFDLLYDCTPGISASGCQAVISSTGTPSASATSGFTLSAATVEGQKDGLFFFGTNGQQANPWGNGTSYQCVAPPVVRTPIMAGIGTVGGCDGSFALDLNALWCPSCSNPAKNPGSGAIVQAQLWYRDPLSTSNQTTSLSDLIEFVVAP